MGVAVEGRMSEYLFNIVTLPGDKSEGNASDAARARGKDKAFKKLEGIANSYGSAATKFEIPTLKVGTQDSLYVLLDEIDKMDKYAASALQRVVRSWCGDMTKDDGSPCLPSELQVEMNDHEVDPCTAVSTFTWNESIFPHKTALPETASAVHAQICELDDEVKDALAKFSQIKNQLNAIDRKSSGNLAVKDLHGIVTIQHYPTHPDGTISDKIVPIIVVVPKMRLEEFMAGYETAFYIKPE